MTTLPCALSSNLVNSDLFWVATNYKITIIKKRNWTFYKKNITGNQMTRAESPLVSLLQSFPADEAVVAFITIPDHHHCHPSFYYLGHRNHQNMIIVIMKMIVMSQMVLSDLMNVAGTTHLTPCSCTTVQVLRKMLFADTLWRWSRFLWKDSSLQSKQQLFSMMNQPPQSDSNTTEGQILAKELIGARWEEEDGNRNQTSTNTDKYSYRPIDT